MLINTAC